MEENKFKAEHHSIEIKSLYLEESRFRLSETTPKISFYDLVDFDKKIHPKPHLPTDPIFYHWTSHNARASSAQLIGHVFPNKLTKIDLSSSEDDVIGLQIWITRCNKPRTDLLIYNIGKKTIQLLQNAASFLKNHFCDFSYILNKIRIYTTRPPPGNSPPGTARSTKSQSHIYYKVLENK